MKKKKQLKDYKLGPHLIHHKYQISCKESWGEKGTFVYSDTVSQAHNNWVHISEEPNTCHRTRGWPSFHILISKQPCTQYFSKKGICLFLLLCHCHCHIFGANKLLREKIEKNSCRNICFTNSF